MRYKILYKSEVIDSAETRRNAIDLVQEYKMAFKSNELYINYE